MFGLGTILSIVTGLGPSVLNIGQKIADYKLAKANTANAKEQQLLDQQIQEAHDRRDVLIAEAGNRTATLMKGLIRFLIILGPISYLLKVTFIDKVIGSYYGCAGRYAASHLEDCTRFVTDPLTFNIDGVTASVIAAACAFYLMYDIASISRKK